MQERWSSRSCPPLDDKTHTPSVIAVLACVKQHIADSNDTPSTRREGAVDDTGDLETDYDDEDVIDEREVPLDDHATAAMPELSLEAAAERAPTALPYMYLRSISIVPVESRAHGNSHTGTHVSADSSRDEQRYLLMQLRRNAAGTPFDSGVGDPTTSRKVDKESSRVWDYCWGKCCGTGDAKLVSTIPMFKPILLYSAFVARNIVTVNAFYLNEHIASASETACSGQRL